MSMQTLRDKQDTKSFTSDYVFDTADEYAKGRYRELSALYDAQTIRHLDRTGIDSGWHCLEVGGGGGSIASWMCQRVGNEGRVLATDIEPRFLRTLCFNNLEVRQHDIRVDALPEFGFNLAHARLVLMHLLGREIALQRMIDSLKPGGWIVVEDFDVVSIFPDPSPQPCEEPMKISRAFYEVMSSRGIDMRYGRRLPQQLRNRGLVNVGAEASMSIWQGDSPGTNMFKLSFEELADSILRSGLVSEAEFEADLKRLGQQDFRMLSPVMWTAWGQVPEFSPYATWLSAGGTTEHEQSFRR
jgi:ubiquinone/menaquinone biosynthesis C-methylase UbiE